MSFSLRVEAADVDWQIRFLKEFPEISDRRFKPAMQQAVGALGGEIEPNIPVRTGKARDTFKERVSGKGLNLKGRVGWWYAGDPWYMNVVEHGARPHEIDSYAPGLGVYIGHHPGFTPRYFMRSAEQKLRQQNDERFERARDMVVQDLAVKA